MMVIDSLASQKNASNNQLDSISKFCNYLNHKMRSDNDKKKEIIHAFVARYTAYIKMKILDIESYF